MSDDDRIEPNTDEYYLNCGRKLTMWTLQGIRMSTPKR